MNLVTDPWIPILKVDGSHVTASLQQVFSEGNDYADLAVRPHERISLMRLLICIAQAALGGPADIDEWDEAPQNLPKAATRYLGRNQECFELFHDEKPFLQIPRLEKISEETPVTKLDFALATGNVSTLFDHGANQSGLRIFPVESLPLMLLTYLNFSPSGLIAQVKWNREPTTKSSNDAPCTTASMYHAYLRRDNVQKTIAANLLTKITVKKFYQDKWGCPVWEKMPQSFDDKDAIQNATETYLGRLVPLSRLILLNRNGQTILLGNGFKYPGYPDVQREPSATAILVGDKKRLLGGGNKEIWRELPSLLVKQHENDLGGALTLSNAPEKESFDIYVGALLRKQGQADVVDTIESVLSVPKGMRIDAGIATYEAEVRHAENVGNRLYNAVKIYFKHLGDNWDEKLRQETDARKRGLLKKQLSDKATNQFWTAVEKLRPLLMAHVDTIGSDADKVKESHGVWRKALHKAARDAYRLTCGQETPRQMRAFALGWDRLFVTRPAEAITSNSESETIEE
jgi:CRISPR system Cascade subunit CasA